MVVSSIERSNVTKRNFRPLAAYLVDYAGRNGGAL